MYTWIDAAADLLLGSTCPGCSLPGWGVCQSCRSIVKQAPVRARAAVDVPVIAASPYRPVLEHVIPRYKDDGALHVERFLGELLAIALGRISAASDGDLVVVPVPSLPRNVRSRGFDHTRRLAARAASSTGLETKAVLRRGNGGADQSGLGREARRNNVTGSMRARALAKPVVIVDDIVTTGATLREACSALKRAGVEVIGAAVIAEVDDLPAMRAKA